VGDPLSAIGHAFALAADRALRPAPLQGYVTHEESARQIRGRLLYDRQISARAGLLMPVEIRYDEYEVDIVENQVVKAALLLIERAVTDREPALARRLTHLRLSLDGVKPWRRGVPVPSIAFGRVNERYRAAFALSRLVLDGRSLEFNDRKHLGTSFLFDMNKVFESYVETKLRATLEQFGGVVHGQERMYLDEDRKILMKPDITWVAGGRHLAVVDAKYKRSTSDDFPNADAYQMLAYCTRLGLRRGWLIYANLDGSAGGTSVVSGNGTEIVMRALDLDGTLDELEARVEALALEICHGSLAV
jgi:5-methylcytosine-specific restriction enzyme subunit McrC